MSDTPETPEPAVRELIAAGEKATPGPWQPTWRGSGMGFDVEPAPHGERGMFSLLFDAQFVALSRNLAPSLARDWLALRERVTALEADLAALAERHNRQHAEKEHYRARAEKAEAEAFTEREQRKGAEQDRDEAREKVAGLEVDRDSWRRKYEALRRSVDEGLNSGEGSYKP